MENTPNLALPYLMPSQAQKHVTHNEALQLLDTIVQLSVASRKLATPPSAPRDGECHIVASPGAGAWSGWNSSIASYADGGWSRLVPRTGWRCWVEDDKELLAWNGTIWQSIGGKSASMQVEGLGVRTAPDTSNRLAVKSDMVLFSHDDVTPGNGSMQMTINKAAAAKEAAIFFQNNWSSRAGIGCFGSDNFQIKVSANGSVWNDALTVSPSTGDIGVGTTAPQGRLHVTSRDYLSITVSNSNADVTAKGGMVCGARYAVANSPFVCFGSWDRGLSYGQREVYFGGGGWNLPDATHLRFYTAPACAETINTGVLRMVITPTGDVGIGTAAPTARLHVNGSLSKTSGSFDIAHPDPSLRETHRLRHCFVEAPTRGENIYRFDVEAVESGIVTITLPEYWQHLNENPQVWASPAGHFGRAHGAVNEAGTALQLNCETPGRYNVLLIGTRRDDDARNYFDPLGVEYEQQATVEEDRAATSAT